MSSPLLITGVHADPTGSDAQLAHGEFFVIENMTPDPVSLLGWSVRDAGGNALGLPPGATVPGRGRVRVFTGRFGGSVGDLALGWRRPFLNNRGGEALELVDPGGLVQHRYTYA